MSLAHDLRSSVRSIIRERGAFLYGTGCVKKITGTESMVSAEVLGETNTYPVFLDRAGDEIIGTCACPYFQSDGICKHCWAVLLAADAHGYLRGNGALVRDFVENWGQLDDNLDDVDDDDFELRPPPASQVKRSTGWMALLNGLPAEADPLHSVDVNEREFWYIVCGASSVHAFDLRLEVRFRERKKTGEWGKLKSSRVSRGIVATLPEPDREALLALGGAPALYDYSGAADTMGATYRLTGPTTAPLLEKLCRTGRCAFDPKGIADGGNLVPMRWDEKAPWTFRLQVEQTPAGWRVNGAFNRDGETLPCEDIVVASRDGILFSRAGAISRFEGRGAFSWSGLMSRSGAVEIPAADADEFIEYLTSRAAVPPIDWPETLRLSESGGPPRAILRFVESRQLVRKSIGELCVFVSFDYGGATFQEADGRSTAFLKDQRVLVRRDIAHEAARIAELREFGIRLGQNCYHPDGRHYHVGPKKLGPAVSQAMAAGWHVELHGRAFRNAQGYSAEISSGLDWFELNAAIDFGPAKAALPDLLRALRQNSKIVQLSDGSFGLLPDELVQQLGPLLGAGAVVGDTVRYSRAQASLLDALLAARPQISVDEIFCQARDRLRSFDRIVPATQPSGFTGQLRHYQAEGLSWMLFLQELGFGGCLADDMGLGKTAQVLALVESRRELRESGQPVAPSLVVVPRSLVFNWKREAEQFTPGLRIRDYSGADRKKGAADFLDCDIALTTYGTLRRDIADLRTVEFDYAILDEAQNIKNATSDSAKAACLIRARHRLAMSGTPIENHLGELFSLFEFLNPGMLGSMAGLSLGGASLRNPDEATRSMLAAAVRPFLLRRTKEQVARELPERTEQTIYCELESAQRKQYDDLRDHYRSILLGRVAADGIAKSKMYILEALLRLRQAACHPGLIDAARVSDPSAKIEALMAQLDEVMSEGHKALVFSQFTSLLSIVRKQLDAAAIKYEYLDGKTRDRQARVDAFQNDPACNLFLISLKAGGLGLNLTAAEYVFLLDPWWNPAVEAQAIDRAHRIGQTNHVFAYRLIARDTVEEKVVELQARKRDLADSIIRADAGLVRDLKREDLEFLLS